MSEPLVIIGNGMAAARLVEELAVSSLGRYAVAVVGEEPRLAYNRVLLSSLLAQEIGTAELELRPGRWWADRGVTLLYGEPATAIDVPTKSVRLASGRTLPYGKLVLATGSRPMVLPIPGIELPGVLTFRNLGDAARISAAAKTNARVVVIGGGLLGLEAAYGAARSGAQVSVVHLMDRLMERQLDARAAGMLRSALEQQGIAVHLNAETSSIVGQHHAEGVAFKSGEVLEADLVIAAIGIRPNVELARTAGLEIGRGVVVGDDLRTSRADIYALGECAEHRGQCYGLVEPAYDQARILARRLAGEDACYAGSLLATNLKVSGIDVFSAGDFLGAEGTGAIIFSDPGVGTYKKLVIEDDRLAGAVLFGDTADALWYLDLIRSRAPIGSMRNDLMFGPPLAQRLAA